MKLLTTIKYFAERFFVTSAKTNSVIYLGIIFTFLIFKSSLMLGNDCTTPTIVNLCPGATYNSETTTGQINDKTAWKASLAAFQYNLIGNDNVYEVNIPVGSVNLWVDVNSPATFYAISTSTCSQLYYNSLVGYSAGCRRISYNVSGITKLYIWIDHANAFDFNYSISFSVVQSIVTTTKGTIKSSAGCISPIFNSRFGLTYNGTQMPYPLVYSPLNTPGTCCYQIFLQNTTGIEALKKISFTFGADLQNPIASTSSFPGFYAAGNWVATQISTNTVEFNFVAANGRGDSDGLPSICHQYNFCLNFTPVSNNFIPTITNFTWWGDGYGNVTTYNGCFSSTLCNPGGMTCTSANCISPGSSSASTGSGSSSDPFLSVNFVNINAVKTDKAVVLSWATIENDMPSAFEIQKSYDLVSFETIEKINSKNNYYSEYSYIDEYVSTNPVYYRIKETDLDGKIEYSKIIEVNNFVLSIYPNPVSDKINIRSSSYIKKVIISTSDGMDIRSYELESKDATIDVSNLEKNIYFLKVITENEVVVKKIFIE
jgi:hypothetical protein